MLGSLSKRLEDLSLVQRERLAYIDFRLYFFGEIGRPDLIERFGVAPAGATRDLALYREIAPHNITFDGSNKIYRIGQEFSPLFEHASLRVLSALSLGFGDGVNGSMQALLPCESPAALSIPKMDVLATICRGIHAKRPVAIRYYSMSSGESERVIVPFALVDTGMRWHVPLIARVESFGISSSPASKHQHCSTRSHKPTNDRITTSSGRASSSWISCRTRALSGPILSRWTIVDATLIHAPSSSKNQDGKRDPEMHQTKKGNQWHFGMKAHIGVDAKSGLTHSLVTTAANEHDLNQLGNLLHGEEQFVSADAGYQGAPQREELAEVDVDWLIAERPGKVRTLKQHPRKNKTAINIEYMKASIRAKVEHPFRIIKRQFGFVKARYKGLLKNDNQLAMLFTLANLFRVDQMIRQWERSH
ncbi:IS5 transposase [Escherichia coli]|nr:IS5 transposase [Escherichia coli]